MRRITFLSAATVAALVLVGGVALAATVVQCGEKFNCYGTSGPDLIKSTDVGHRVYARGGDDVLRGRGGGDFLKGQKGNDELRGGSESDYAEGGPGRDTLVGGPGGDYYVISASGWGRDSVIDSATSRLDVDTGNSLYIGYFFTGDLTISLVSGPGPEVVDTGADGGTGTMDWEGDAVDNIFGRGSGAYDITGNDRANLLAGGGGDTTIRAGGGDDRVYVDDGSGGDIVSCGEDGEGIEDNDIVYRDPPDPDTGDSGDIIDPDCEVEKDREPITTDGAFSRAGP